MYALHKQRRECDMILITHGAYFDARIQRRHLAGELVSHTDRAAFLIVRLKNAGAVDVQSRELTTEEYAARVRASFAHLAR